MMDACYMYGKEVGEVLLPKTCWVCERTFPATEHVTAFGCYECFSVWYDGDDAPESVDRTLRRDVGNWVRKKHGLPPLT